MKDFECEICESKENPQSEQWEEMCIYCNEMCLISNLEIIREQIKKHEWRISA